ncbi:hypothetical protein ACUOFC_68580, partial [Escherichia sp. TWPC-MK]
CPEFTARLVDRWQELENGAGMVVPQTLPEALRMAADLAEQKQRLRNHHAGAVLQFLPAVHKTGCELRA